MFLLPFGLFFRFRERFGLFLLPVQQCCQGVGGGTAGIGADFAGGGGDAAGGAELPPGIGQEEAEAFLIGIAWVRNARPEDGMYSSVRTGLAYALERFPQAA